MVVGMMMTLVVMVVVVPMLVLTMVMMVMLILVCVLGGRLVAVEPGHIVIVVLELLGKLNVKVAGVDAVLVDARHGNRKAVDRQRGELLAQVLLAGA